MPSLILAKHWMSSSYHRSLKLTVSNPISPCSVKMATPVREKKKAKMNQRRRAGITLAMMASLESLPIRYAQFWRSSSPPKMNSSKWDELQRTNS